MNARVFDPDNPRARTLRARLASRWKLGAFMASKLPMGLLAGLRITHVDAEWCTCQVRYGWLTTNPFKSTYFAVLAMAAEMSTGALALAMVRTAPEPVSILVTGLQADFVKKATDTTTFTCADGPAFADALRQTLRTGEGVTVDARTVGRNLAGDEVARFTITWSLKRRASRR